MRSHGNWAGTARPICDPGTGKYWRNADTGVQLNCFLAGATFGSQLTATRFMPPLPRDTTSCLRLRDGLLGLLVMCTLTGCDRFKERILGFGRSPNVADASKGFDSQTIRRDSIFRHRQAAQDSLDAMSMVRRATDSLTRGARTAATVATASTAPIARGAMPTQPVSRAQTLGDSMANARADQLAGQNSTAVAGDSLRGMVKMDGSGPGSRPILLMNRGKTVVTLSGMGTDGLRQVLGSEVVVRGMRVSPGDIVVSSFSVRAVNGIPTIDGRLMKSSGGWTIELSDKSGVRKLASVPEALQAFEGARVWVAEEAKNAVPQLYGVIARR